jgi:hypothetical protein
MVETKQVSVTGIRTFWQSDAKRHEVSDNLCMQFLPNFTISGYGGRKEKSFGFKTINGIKESIVSFISNKANGWSSSS